MAYDYPHRIARAMTRSGGLLAAILVLLALFVGAESWRNSTPCSTAAPCIVASDDMPEASGDIVAIVELSDDMSSDGPFSPSDEKAYKEAVAADRLFFAVAAIAVAAVLDRQRRTLYPDKTGPPRA
jgi:hypothetical protein